MIEQASTNTPVPSGGVQVYFLYLDCACWGYGAATGWNGTSTWRPKGGSEG